MCASSLANGKTANGWNGYRQPASTRGSFVSSRESTTRALLSTINGLSSAARIGPVLACCTTAMPGSLSTTRRSRDISKRSSCTTGTIAVGHRGRLGVTASDATIAQIFGWEDDPGDDDPPLVPPELRSVPDLTLAPLQL